MKRFGYAWVTLIFFLFSVALHWAFGWSAYLDEAGEHGQTPEFAAYAIEMGRDTFENWQSEFLQLLWQVVGLAYLLYVGSPSSKENDDRMEAKLDALLQLVGKERGEALINTIDERHERRGGHAGLYADPPLEEPAHKPGR